MQPLALIFLIMNAADYYTGGEWFNVLVAVGWIAFAVIAIVIEVFIPGVYIHRLVVSPCK